MKTMRVPFLRAALKNSQDCPPPEARVTAGLLPNVT